MELESRTLRDIALSQKDKLHVISYMWILTLNVFE